MDSPSGVRKEVVDYFTSKVADSPWLRSTLDGVTFSMLSTYANRELVANFALAGWNWWLKKVMVINVWTRMVLILRSSKSFGIL